MSRAMFEYTKTVLNKVSFNTPLFCREVQKALSRLLPYEIEELKLFIQGLVNTNPDLKKCLIYLSHYVLKMINTIFLILILSKKAYLQKKSINF